MAEAYWHSRLFLISKSLAVRSIKTLKKIHRYLGVALSILLLLVSITGVMLVWKREYLWVTIPEARELRAEQSVLAQAASVIESSHPEGEVMFARFYSEGLSVHKVYLTGRRYAWHDQNGNLIQVWKSNERFEDWLLDLHHRLLLGNTIGLNVVGLGGLLAIFLMLMGVVIWWPWRRGYSMSFVPNNGRHGSLLKSHSQTGVTIALPALLIVVTGVILVYPTESRYVLRDGFGDPVPPTTMVIVAPELSSNLDWPTAFDYAQRSFPEGSLHWLSYPRADSSSFTIGVQEASSFNVMANTSIKFGAQQSVTVKHQSEQSISQQALDYTYPLHTGKFPTWYRLLLSLAGVLLAWLSFLGLLAFLKRKR